MKKSQPRSRKPKTRKTKYKKFQLPIPVSETKPKLHPVNWARETVAAGVTKQFIVSLVNKEFMSKKDQEWLENLKDEGVKAKNVLVFRGQGSQRRQVPAEILDADGCRAVRILTEHATSKHHGLEFNGKQWLKVS